MNLIDSTTPRHQVRDHLGACGSCAALFAFAREHQDLEALDAWRRQLAAHLRNDRERKDFGQRAVRRTVAA